MSFQPIQGFEGVAIEPERALNIGVGVAAAPLWAAFYATAGLGAAWWWSTAWTRTAPSFDLDAILAPEPAPAAQAYVEALDDAVCDLIETSQEEAEAAIEVAEAVEESLELAQDVAVEGLRDVQDDIQEAIALAAQTEAAAEPLVAAAASDEVVAEPVVVESGDLPVEKPSKKKAPKGE